VLATLLVVLCAPRAAHARVAGWHPEYGFAFRPLVGVGSLADLAGPAAGFDFDLHIVNEAGGPGMRAVFGTNPLASERAPTSGTILWWDVSGSYDTDQSISWWALGPSWSFPRHESRTEIYVLAGMGTATASGSGTLVNTGGAELASPSSAVLIAGALWCPHLPNSGISAELGAELHMGGLGTFWDSPAIVADGGGGYLRSYRQAAMRGFALRFGFSYQRHARKR
jgi:hypothetical protein